MIPRWNRVKRHAGGKSGVPLSPPAPQDPGSFANIEALAKHLLWDPSHLQEIIADLKEKRQVSSYGAPGTGKTYVTRRIATLCEDNGGGFEISSSTLPIPMRISYRVSGPGCTEVGPRNWTGGYVGILLLN